MAHRPIYLDNASTTWPKPPEVAQAMSRFLMEGAATPGRGGYAMAARNAETVARLRSGVAAMIGSPDADHLVLTPGATDAFNMAILGLFDEGAAAGRRPHVVMTALEHNAVRRPLCFLRSRGVIDLTDVPCDADGVVGAGDVLAALTDRTALVAVMSASNAIGTLTPVGEICRALRAARPEILTLVDASQTVGLLSTDAGGDAIDLMAFPGHKALMGPTGTGFLYVSPRAAGEEPGPRLHLQPARFGGTGGDSGNEEMPASMPARFEPGSINTVGFVGLLAAMQSPSRPPPEACLAHERALVARAIAGLAGARGVRIIGTPDVRRRMGVLTLTLDGWAPSDLGVTLDSRYGICIRAGLHCAPGAHRALGTYAAGGAVRMSPGIYSTEADVDAFVNAILELSAATLP